MATVSQSMVVTIHSCNCFLFVDWSESQELRFWLVYSTLKQQVSDNSILLSDTARWTGFAVSWRKNRGVLNEPIIFEESVIFVIKIKIDNYLLWFLRQEGESQEHLSMTGWGALQGFLVWNADSGCYPQIQRNPCYLGRVSSLPQQVSQPVGSAFFHQYLQCHALDCSCH